MWGRSASQVSLALFHSGCGVAGAVPAYSQLGYPLCTYLSQPEQSHDMSIHPISFVLVPGIDHSYWGRPEDQTGPRPALIWNASTPASDLLGAVSAGLASTSLVFKQQGKASYAAKLLKHAKQLYAWARQNQGARACLRACNVWRPLSVLPLPAPSCPAVPCPVPLMLPSHVPLCPF